MKKATIFITTLVVVGTFCYWQNNDITITDIDFKSDKLPKNFNNFKILQVSDLHNKKFGKNQKKLVQLTKKINPDIIVVTGDVIDSRRTNINIAVDYIKQAAQVCPVYYVPGNHEKRISNYNQLKEILLKDSIIILDNKSEEIKIGNEKISLIGIEDISFINSDESKVKFINILKSLKMEAKNNLAILLSHRPDLIDVYANENIDLVFSGHAHGGQIRLPFVGGLFAPNQGILPQFTNGIYEKDNTKMIVSRGLGNSLFPFRIFNKPELIVTTLKTKPS